MENNLVFPFWVGKIFISFEASRQPYTGSRGLVSWCAWLLQQIELQLQSDRNINPMRFLWNQKAHNTKIVQTFFSSTLPLQNHYYYVIEIFKLKYLSPIRTVREIRTVRQQSDRVRRSGPCRTSDHHQFQYNALNLTIYVEQEMHYIWRWDSYL